MQKEKLHLPLNSVSAINKKREKRMFLSFYLYLIKAFNRSVSDNTGHAYAEEVVHNPFEYNRYVSERTGES